MQKILLIICAILTTTSVHATQMCARRDTTVIPLDASIDHKDYGYDKDEYLWWSIYEYGWIYGFATCLSLPEIQEYVPEWAAANAGPTLPTNDEALLGREGEYIASDGTVYPRQYCYCKMIHPMSSRWEFFGINQWGDARGTTTGCAKIGTIPERTELFNTIGYGYADINDTEYTESIDL